MWLCLYDVGLLHVISMKSHRSEGFLMVFVENDANHV